jgi:hypothetical protein
VPKSGDKILTDGDLETARRYGVRMREAITRWEK